MLIVQEEIALSIDYGSISLHRLWFYFAHGELEVLINLLKNIFLGIK